MNKFRIWLALLLAITLLAVPASALAAPIAQPAGDEVIFGDSYTLAAGQVLDGNLVVFGGNVSIEAGATVLENLVVFGGNVELDGTVLGDLVVIGGNVDLRATAVVEGDLVNPGGNINRAPGAEVRGNLVTEFNFGWLRGMDGFRVGWGFNGAWQLIKAVAMAAIALLVAFLVPDHLRRTSDSIVKNPVTAGGLGLLTLILTPFALVITIITCVLPPIILLVVGLASLFGWVALGFELGRRLALALHADWSLLIQVTLGTFLLTLAAGFITWIPCIGWLAGILLGAVGLGAALLTRFGTLKEPEVPQPAATKAKPVKRAAKKRSTRSR